MPSSIIKWIILTPRKPKIWLGLKEDKWFKKIISYIIIQDKKCRTCNQYSDILYVINVQDKIHKYYCERCKKNFFKSLRVVDEL